jgi:hypothetical protein
MRKLKMEITDHDYQSVKTLSNLSKIKIVTENARTRTYIDGEKVDHVTKINCAWDCTGFFCKVVIVTFGGSIITKYAEVDIEISPITNKCPCNK